MSLFIEIPKTFKYSKTNPLEDFYSKCLLRLNKNTELNGIQVIAFSVNLKDYKKLTKALVNYLKNNQPFLSYKKLNFTAKFTMVDMGPRVDNTVPNGFVRVNLEKLYKN